MTYILGQAPDGPCPVCRLSPVGLREIEGFPELAECARCGLLYAVRDAEGRPIPRAQPAASPGFVEVFRLYYQQTGNRLGVPIFLVGTQTIESPAELPPDLLARTQLLDEWLHAHPHLVAGAAAPQTWPYAGVTVVAVEMDGEPTWRVLVPPAGLLTAPMIPFSPHGLPLGTIVSIQIPLHQADVRPEPEEGHA